MRDIGILKGPDLIQLLNTLLEEGALNAPGKLSTLYARNIEKGHLSKLIFFEGYFAQGVSSDYKIRLGDLLLQKNLIKQNDLDTLLREQRKRPDLMIGQLLLEKGLLNERELIARLNHLTEIVGYEILMWQETEFKLDVEDLNEQDINAYVGANVSLEHLLSIKNFTQDAEKNLPVVALIKDTFNNPNMIVRQGQLPDDGELSQHQNQVYQHINNKNNLREILMLSDFDYFETYTILFQLVSWGIANLGGTEVPTHTPKIRSTPSPARSVPPTRPSQPTAVAMQKASSVKESIPRETKRQFIKKTAGSELLHILVSVLSSGKNTGKLGIENQKNDIRSEITMYQGNLVHAMSTMYSDRFGDLLVKKGVITPDQLSEALSEQKKTPGIRLGEIMLRMGLIELGTIPKLIFHQIECVLYEVLSWPEAKFYFEEQKEEDVSQTDYVIHADYEIVEGRLVSKSKGDDEAHLLGDADKNLPVLLLIKEKMPHPSAVVQKTQQVENLQLSDSQKDIMIFVNGINSINDIVVLSDMDYFQTYATLFQLYSWGALEILPVHRMTPAATNTPQAPVERQEPTQTIRDKTSVDVSRSEKHTFEPSKSEKIKQLLEEQKRELVLLKSRLRKYQKLDTLFGEELLQKLYTLPARKQQYLRTILETLVEFGGS